MNTTSLARTLTLLLLFFAANRPSTAYSQGCSQALAAADRQHCQELFNHQVQAGTRTTQLPGGWRLVRTPNPAGGPEAVSVLHAADSSGSDIAFAGLTIRCGQPDTEVLLILLNPLVRGSQYRILTKSGSAQTQFEAKAVQGGEVLLLPHGATDLANGSWQTEPELSVDIATPSPIHGSLPLAGLPSAMQALSQNCPAH